MSSSQIKKNNINELSLIFKEKILLNPYRVENLKKFATEGVLSKELLRPTAWRIFLGVLPNTTSLREWVEIISSQREEFKKKIKKFCKIKKFIGDPLGGGTKKKKTSAESYEDSELKIIINKDLDRTRQEIDLFLQSKIKNILANVLYIWSKENPSISYRQGMHELLAIIFLVFFPYYFPCTRKPKNTKNDIIEFLKDIELYKEDIYIFFHDEEEMQSDLFFVFEALMKKGMANLFNPKILDKDDPEYKIYEIFPQMWKGDSDQNKPTYVYRRCDLLIKEKLKSLDNDLYSHFKRVDLNCVVFLQRWLRCIFSIEFPLEDVYILWDYIICNNYINENTQKYYFICMEYICIAMIFKIRDTLKDADQSECFSTLFKYPETKDIMEIIKLSHKVEQAINERLNGKNSNVYDILGIMKPIESEPSHLFSQDVYNQPTTKKTEPSSNNYNININTNSSTKEKNNKKIETNKSKINNEVEKVYKNNSINVISNINSTNSNSNTNYNNNDTFENFDEDEKENINLDSVKHDSNNNDISSQAKSFFNSALNSLTNFGGIIKDQLQNAKDTVMDSFTGNENNNSSNYNNYNNYEDNYQNDNYYEYNNNNYSNNTNYNQNNNSNNFNSFNSEKNNNHINDSVQRKNSVEHNEENKNQNNIERKASVDSTNEIGYNRQDIMDIVNKLKEFDTRYNMFMNDEDKKNFRIIINYLKGKL